MHASDHVEFFEAPIKLGVVSDTHLGRNVRQLPDILVRELRSVDLILHAGDLTSVEALTLFEAIAPVRAVAGNNDVAELMRRLPRRREFRFGRFTAAMIHGHGYPKMTARKAAEAVLKGRYDIAFFGHSHRPVCEWMDGTLLFNPGSATNKRWEPCHSFGIVRIGDEIDAELRFIP